MNEEEKIITKYWSERRSIDEEMKEFWLKVPPRMTLDEYPKPLKDEFKMFMKGLGF